MLNNTNKTNKFNRNTSQQPGAFNRFWDKHIELLNKNNVKHKAHTWYVKNAERYIKAYPNKKLITHSAKDVELYLTQLLKRQDLKAWQLEQNIDAIQKLFQLLHVNWFQPFTWDDWVISAQSINSNGFGEVYLPNALAKKYPNAKIDLAWQYLLINSIHIGQTCET